MNSQRNLEQDWLVLASDKHRERHLGIPSLDTGVSTGEGQIFIALAENGRRRLLIPVRLTELSGVRPGPALSISLLELEVDGKSLNFIDIKCMDTSLNQVFTDVSAEIVDRIDDGTDAMKAVAVVLDEYRRLLDRGADDGVDAALIGLVGELLVLNQITSFSPLGFSFWRGPDQGVHDFQCLEKGLEVKCSTRDDYRTVSISSIDQLDIRPGSKLFLVYVLLAEADEEGDSFSIADLVDQIVANGVDGDKLQEKAALVLGAGALRQQRDLKFSLQNINVYKVVDGFPKLTRGSLVSAEAMRGLLDLKYTIDLAGAGQYLLDESEVQTMFKAFTGH